MNISAFVNQMNSWGQQQVPFLFAVDFEMRKPLLWELSAINSEKILFDIDGFSNSSTELIAAGPVSMTKYPLSLPEYTRKFESVMRHLAYGDSYLTNLTVKVEIDLTHSLRELFFKSRARYKLWYDDQFLVFSPETFVRIEHGKIFSYPMKGTIDASVPDAEAAILADKKELAEHVTIVDLIRNDLSQVATNVEVTRFRYIDEIRTTNKKLLQVSSEIKGDLPPHYENSLGNILMTMLPAGSITGAPKPKTVSIIKEAEGEERGYYTGVFGYFDGKKLDSGVMIRFIEREHKKYFYRSGGGITTQSVVEKEYQEIIDKIYVPVA